MKTRCEGWRRTGGAFSFGPVRWEQCPNDAVVELEVVQDGVESTFPACLECWREAMGHGMTIKKATVIPQTAPK